MTNLSTKYGFRLIVISFLLMLFSCEKPPDYSESPEISFNSIEHTFIEGDVFAGQNAEEQVVINVNYTDGDGDLGITEDDSKDSKYDKYRDSILIEGSFELCQDTIDGEPIIDTCNIIPDSIITIYYNYLIIPYRQTIFGTFEEVELSSPLHSRFDPLLDQSLLSPIDGVLTFNFTHLKGTAFRIGDVIKYEVYIFDRENNRSNSIETDPITLFL